jgi:hypothetical protein
MDLVSIPRDSTQSCNSRSEQLYGILTKNNFDILLASCAGETPHDCYKQTLSGFGSSRILFPDLPMLEGVNVTTPRAIPCPFLRVGISRVNHLHDQMTVQAHRRFAIHIFRLHGLSHSHPPDKFALPLAIQLPMPFLLAKSTKTACLYWTDRVHIR